MFQFAEQPHILLLLFVQKNLVTNVVMNDVKQKDLSKMATYHAIKTGPLLQSLHKHVMENHIQTMLKRTAQLQYDIDAMKSVLQIKKVSKQIYCVVLVQ